MFSLAFSVAVFNAPFRYGGTYSSTPQHHALHYSEILSIPLQRFHLGLPMPAKVEHSDTHLRFILHASECCTARRSPDTSLIWDFVNIS